jgi:hypothetical protein
MVKRGVISEARIDESFNRIMKAKMQMASGDQIALLKQELEALKVSLDNAIEAVREVNQTLETATPVIDTGSDKKKEKKKENRIKD